MGSGGGDSRSPSHAVPRPAGRGQDDDRATRAGLLPDLTTSEALEVSAIHSSPALRCQTA